MTNVYNTVSHALLNDPQNSTLLTQINNASNSWINNASIRKTLQQTFLDTRAIDVQNLLNIIAGIPGDSNIISYLKEVFTFQLNTLSQGILNYNQTQINPVIQIAQMCSLDAGPAVLYAQNNLRMLNIDFVESNCLPPPVIFGKNLGVKNTENILYPNPANSEINIQLKDTKIESYGIFDFSGRNVMSATDLHDNELKINVQILRSGLYLLQTTSESEQKSTYKFIKE